MSEEYAVPATGALIRNMNGKIFLMKSPKWGGKWLVPGGKVEKGDSMKETVRKEVLEETGLEVKNIELMNVKDGGNPDDFSRDTHFIFLNFTCRAKNKDVELDQREAVDYTWIEPEKALNSDLEINKSTLEFIENYLDERQPS